MRRGRIDFRGVIQLPCGTVRPLRLLSLALVGCSAAPPAPPPAPTVPALITIPPATASASAAAPPAPPAAPEWVVDEDGKGTPISFDLDAAKVPEAPCFGERVYRGTIGKDHLTLKIATDGDRLSGLVHYDVAGSGIELSGKRRGDSFSIDEKGAGRFEGKCDPRTGRLAGDYALKGKKTAFSLAPRPQGEVAIHAVHDRVRVASPVPPYCAKLGRTTETKTVKEGYCLPSDPKALAALQEESGAGVCTLERSVPRVFGLATPGAERAANAALSLDALAEVSAEVRADVKRCPLGGEVKAGTSFSIAYNANDVLSAYLGGYVSAANAPHGANFGPEPVVVDLRTGSRLAIGDVVNDEAAFREAILACDERFRDDIEWGGKDSSLKAPRWVVVPGGIAVIVGTVPLVKNGMQGRGPIATFATLAQRKLLRADSPVARLWAGVTPAAKDAPFCQAMMGSGEILAVRQRPPSH